MSETTTCGARPLPTRLTVGNSNGYGQLNGVAIKDPRTGFVVAVAIGDVPELDAMATAHLFAAAPELLAALRAIGGEDGHLLNQIATFIGGMADAYNLTGEARVVAEGYFKTLHALADNARAIVAKATEE